MRMTEYMLVACAQKRQHLPLHYFDSSSEAEWENMYKACMNKKYAKGTRHFCTEITGTPSDECKIYVVPRVRAGPSYKSIKLNGVDNSHVQYCPVSKGFPMQDLSSFTLGPVVGEGLCIVNAAFSKQILIGHIQGNGCFDATAVGHWKWKGAAKRVVKFVGYDADGDAWVEIDGIKHHAITWLTDNMNLWYSEWDKWRRSIALCSEGSFHWEDKLGYAIGYHGSKDLIAMGHPTIIGFVEWKKTCYIRPAYWLMRKTSVFAFLKELRKRKIPIALVHPKGVSDQGEFPVNVDQIRDLYDDPFSMSCMPWVVAGRLLKVPVYADTS